MKRTEAEEIVRDISIHYFANVLEDYAMTEGSFIENVFAARGLTSEDMYKLGLALVLLSNFQ